MKNRVACQRVRGRGAWAEKWGFVYCLFAIRPPKKKSTSTEIMFRLCFLFHAGILHRWQACEWINLIVLKVDWIIIFFTLYMFIYNSLHQVHRKAITYSGGKKFDIMKSQRGAQTFPPHCNTSDFQYFSYWCDEYFFFFFFFCKLYFQKRTKKRYKLSTKY